MGAVIASSSLLGTANAASAYDTQFTTSVTYQNVGSAAAQVQFSFYSAGSATPVTPSAVTLNAGAGTSLFLANVSGVDAGFSGSAVVSSDQPIVATMVQVPQGNAAVRNRPLSNGFTSGASKFLIATVLKAKFGSTTKFSVQNVDTEALNLTVTFYDADANGAQVGNVKTISALPAGSAAYISAADADLGLPTGLSGSAVITAKKADGTDGNIVASALELSTTGTGASSFEGVSTGSNRFYMPSAMCKMYGGVQSSSYAVQNTGDDGAADAVVTVNYSNGKTESQTIKVGAKASFPGCNVNPAGYSGSAIITATGNKIVAIGKVTGGGLSTAFVGASAGSSKLALPYVRWTESLYTTASNGRQRTYITIQNVGSSDLAAGDVKVHYLDKTGAEVATYSVPAITQGNKVSTWPVQAGAAANELGYYTDGTFGASAIVEGPSGSQLVVVARVQSADTSGQVAEDYNGIPVQ